jgi:hypothetical protein
MLIKLICFHTYLVTIVLIIGWNCVYGNVRLKPNDSTLAPCSVLSHSYAWNISSSCYSGSEEGQFHSWVNDSMEGRLTSCCQLFRSIFNHGNIDDIFQIMKFSLGQQMPKSLKQISQMKEQEYSSLFPNEGNFTALKTLGCVRNYLCSIFV